MRIIYFNIVLLGILISFGESAYAQGTVFSGLKSDIKRADDYYKYQSYHQALNLYLQLEKRDKGGQDIYLKIARTYHLLNQPGSAVKWFEKYLKHSNTLAPPDAYVYAESLTSNGDYQNAIAWYKKFQQATGNQEVTEKIWQLQNINHLYADSSYFEIKPLSFNTGYGEYGPYFNREGLMFVSNRKLKGGVANIDPITNQPFKSLYLVTLAYDSANAEYTYGKPREYLKEYQEKLHQGTAATSGSKLIYTRNASEGNPGVLQLFWLEYAGGTWKTEKPFQYNSLNYSVSHPTLNEDGNVLYFVSDMPGGIGGNDLYKSTLTADGWSAPVNLGSPINTNGNETAPFIHRDRTLYFASNGHGGFGGLDVFKTDLKNQSMEVQNLGYPINSPFDDFGLILNQEGSLGFMASNRKNGGFDDDLYEVAVDLQSYPLVISGVVRFNDPDWSEPQRLEVLGNARLKLVDNIRGLSVYETHTGKKGEFTLKIPYASQYKLQVFHKNVGQPSASLEIPKNRKQHTDHEIVVIKENTYDSEQDRSSILIGKQMSSGKLEKDKK